MHCRDNFVKIQLFYGDISYDSIEQSPAYDTETLLGTFYAVAHFLIITARRYANVVYAIPCVSLFVSLYVYYVDVKRLNKNKKRQKRQKRGKNKKRFVNVIKHVTSS